MKTLKEFNENALMLHADLTKYPKPNGIECPKCKKELMDSDCMVLCSYPPQKNVECECGYKGYRFC